MQPAATTARTPAEAGPSGHACAAPDARELRRVLGNFVTGVTIVTTVDATGRRWGLTANSFASVSLDPPLILWNQSLAAPSHPVFRDAPRFAINILAQDQLDLSRRFAGPSTDKFAGLALREGLGGVPLLAGCAAWLECRQEALLPGGDHAVFIGRVERMGHEPRAPLVFGQGRYLAAHPLEGRAG